MQSRDLWRNGVIVYSEVVLKWHWAGMQTARITWHSQKILVSMTLLHFIWFLPNIFQCSWFQMLLYREKEGELQKRIRFIDECVVFSSLGRCVGSTAALDALWLGNVVFYLPQIELELVTCPSCSPWEETGFVHNWRHVTVAKQWSYWHTHGIGQTRSRYLMFFWPCIMNWLYRVSQEEWTKLRESVPYVKIYRYNPKHLYPKLNGYGDNDHRSLKLWQLLHTYWLPNSY